MLKKFLALSLIAASLLAAAPTKKAHAGIILLAAPFVANEMTGVETGLTFAGGVVAFVAGITTASNSMMILDAQTADPKLMKELAARYPFLDNTAALEKLARALQNGCVPVKGTVGYASLSEMEIRDIVADQDLNEFEISRLVEDLI